MGTDILGFLEYQQPHNLGYACWASQIALPRDYLWFTLLAGVRNTFGLTPDVAPRGLPPQTSMPVLEQFFVTVVPDAVAATDQRGAFREIHASTAAAWRQLRPHLRETDLDAVSPHFDWRQLPPDLWETDLDAVGPHFATPDHTPLLQSVDWHTPSWLTLAELEAVRLRYRDLCPAYPGWATRRDIPDLAAALMGAMHAMPQARFVFWFDQFI